MSLKAFQNRRRNRSDVTGKILRCHTCGTSRHLSAFCPDSWENLERVKVIKEEVLSKGYSWGPITKLWGVEITLLFLIIVIVAVSVVVKERAKVVDK